MKIYLDNCCFNRPYDDQNQLRIRLEAEAKLAIQEMIQRNKIELAWSYVTDYENEQNPFKQKRILIHQWKNYATINIKETPEIISIAENLVQIGFKSKDSLHLACALSANCDYFITTDDQLIKRSVQIDNIKVIDPFNFMREEFEC